MYIEIQRRISGELSIAWTIERRGQMVGMFEEKAREKKFLSAMTTPTVDTTK
jgi:hypothetical protein